MLLARTAESVYWAGRYLERAEDMARIVLVHGDTHVDLPVGEDIGWSPLLEIAGVEQAYAQRHWGSRLTAEGHRGDIPATEAEVVEFLLFDDENPSAVLASVSGAREALRLARPAVPREAWELCNDLWLALGEQRAELRTRDARVRLLRRVIADCQRVNGALWGIMRRDAAMAFLRIGQYLERVDLTCRLLEVRADDAVVEGRDDPYYEIRSMGVLRSLAAYQPFRRAMPTRPGEGSTLEFLLRDEAFPRAAASCLSELRGYLKELPCNEEPLEACTDAAVRLAGTPVGQLSAPQLRRFVVELQPMLATIHDRLASTYFHGAPMERAAGQEQRSAPQVRRRPLAALRPDTADVAMSGRRYQVTHRTTYRYQAPAELSHVEAHLRPRETARQQCLSYELDVEPEPSTWSEQADLFGNRVTKLIVRGHFDVLSVTSRSEVAVTPAPEPPEGPPWESVRTLLERDRQPETRDARRYRATSRLVPTSPVLSEYAQESFAPGRPFVEAVVELSTRINRDFKYEPGFTSVTTPLLEVFEARRGVCQDFAHLAVACLRAVGLSARYVSGYIETIPPPGAERMTGADASHAWASAYLPGWGWLDVDPTNDQLVSDSHVTTAWGRDYWDVSPLRGTVEGGGASHTLEVAVDVVRLGSGRAGLERS